MNEHRSERPRLLLVTTGSWVYRAYLLASLAEDYDVWLFAERELDWAAPHVVGYTQLDTSDVDAMIEPARAVAPDGVLTWDEPRVVHAARLAAALGLPGCTPESALRCRDKHATRTALAAAGVPQATSILVTTLAQARAAAEQVGYPLVLKARALGASIGVVKVERPDQLVSRFRIARGADVPTVTEMPPGDVLVEEYLQGPEISIDAGFADGVMSIGYLARKQIGYPPYFEEIGHLVDGADPLLQDDQLRKVLAASHEAVGYHTGWTHTELRLTPDGPKVVEINARIGGDRIPHLADLATGVRAATAAAAIACGRSPDVRPVRSRVAGIRFCYPDRDVVVREVRIDWDKMPATVAFAEPIAEPGKQLLLPPAGHVSSRYAYVTVVADTVEQCTADLAAAADAISLDLLAP